MADPFAQAVASLNMLEGTAEMRASFKALREALVRDDGWSETMAEQVAGQAFATLLNGIMATSAAEHMAEQMANRMRGQG